jgi:hypothetical protein
MELRLPPLAWMKVCYVLRNVTSGHASVPIVLDQTLQGTGHILRPVQIHCIETVHICSENPVKF